MKDKKTPMKAIRAKCRDCCCQQLKEIRLCQIYDCSLWPYRFGKRPEDALLAELAKKRQETQERRVK